MKSKIKFPFIYSIATACLVAMAALISSGCDGDSDNDSFSGPSGEGNAGIVISNETLEFLNAAVNGTANGGD